MATFEHIEPTRLGGAVLLASSLLLSSGTALGQTLKQLATRVAEEHPRVRLLRAQVRAAEFEVQQVGASHGVRVSTFIEPAKTSSMGSELPSMSGSDMGVRLAYPVYDWGKGTAETNQARARKDAAQARLDVEIAAQWAKLSATYIEATRYERETSVAHAYVSSLQELRVKIQTVVQADKGRASELQQVESRIHQANLYVLQRQAAATEALIQLRAQTNLPGATPVALESPNAHFPPSIDSVIVTLDKHPALQEATFQIDESQQGVYAATAQEKPQLDLQASLSSRDSAGRFKALRTADVRLISQWEIYDGGIARTRTASAQERLHAAREQAESVRHDLDADLRRTWSRQKEGSARAALWKKQIAFSMQLRDFYWEQFRVGRRPLTDLLNVENDIYQAQLSEVVEQHDVLQSEYRMFIQSGLAKDLWK